MTSAQIEKFIALQKRYDKELSVHCKDRQSESGVFIRAKDYSELKSKNL
jgi:hypothetical protein